MVSTNNLPSLTISAMPKAKKYSSSQETVAYLALYTMFESLSAEIKVLTVKNEAKISPDISNAPTTTISINSLEIPFNLRLYLSLLRCFLLKL